MVDIHVIETVGITRWYDAVRQFYALVGYTQIIDNDDTVVIASIDDCIVACCRLCREFNTSVVRGMQVHPNYWRQGIGSYVMNIVKDLIAQEECYCLSFIYLEKFYNKAGFVKIAESEAPSGLLRRLHDYRNLKYDLIVMKKEKIGPINETKNNI